MNEDTTTGCLIILCDDARGRTTCTDVSAMTLYVGGHGSHTKSLTPHNSTPTSTT